jgi:hypothetical protein
MENPKKLLLNIVNLTQKSQFIETVAPRKIRQLYEYLENYIQTKQLEGFFNEVRIMNTFYRELDNARDEFKSKFPEETRRFSIQRMSFDSIEYYINYFYFSIQEAEVINNTVRILTNLRNRTSERKKIILGKAKNIIEQLWKQPKITIPRPQTLIDGIMSCVGGLCQRRNRRRSKPTREVRVETMKPLPQHVRNVQQRMRTIERLVNENELIEAQNILGPLLTDVNKMYIFLLNEMDSGKFDDLPGFGIRRGGGSDESITNIEELNRGEIVELIGVYRNDLEKAYKKVIFPNFIRPRIILTYPDMNYFKNSIPLYLSFIKGGIKLMKGRSGFTKTFNIIATSNLGYNAKRLKKEMREAYDKALENAPRPAGAGRDGPAAGAGRDSPAAGAGRGGARKTRRNINLRNKRKTKKKQKKPIRKNKRKH